MIILGTYYPKNFILPSGGCAARPLLLEDRYLVQTCVSLLFLVFRYCYCTHFCQKFDSHNLTRHHPLLPPCHRHHSTQHKRTSHSLHHRLKKTGTCHLKASDSPNWCQILVFKIPHTAVNDSGDGAVVSASDLYC